jgi:hypothetical protein
MLGRKQAFRRTERVFLCSFQSLLAAGTQRSGHRLPILLIEARTSGRPFSRPQRPLPFAIGHGGVTVPDLPLRFPAAFKP